MLSEPNPDISSFKHLLLEVGYWSILALKSLQLNKNYNNKYKTTPSRFIKSLKAKFLKTVISFAALEINKRYILKIWRS